MSRPTTIPALKRKFELLRTFGPRQTRAALAGAFGVKPKTLDWWEAGDASRAPGDVPAKHMPTLFSVFADALPTSLTADHVSALVFGKTDDLERALKSRTGPTLENFIQREGRTDTWTINRASDLSFVEVDDGRDDLPVVTLGERFRISFDPVRSGHVIALQHTQQAWAVVALSNTSPSLHRAAARIDVPAMRDGGTVFMREDAAPGVHRFIVFVTVSALPLSLVEMARAGLALDRNVLADLAEHLDRTAPHQREIHVLTIRVSRP